MNGKYSKNNCGDIMEWSKCKAQMTTIPPYLIDQLFIRSEKYRRDGIVSVISLGKHSIIDNLYFVNEKFDNWY